MALLAVLTRALTASVSAALVFVAISFSKATIQFETREPEEFSVELPNCGVIIVIMALSRYQVMPCGEPEFGTFQFILALELGGLLL